MAESVAKEAKLVARHAGIYGLANVMERAVGFVMIPVYTRYLMPADYGILELIYLTTSIISLVIGMGIESAVSRFYFDFKDERSRGLVFSSAAVGYGGFSIVVILLFLPFSKILAGEVLDSSDNALWFQIALVTLCFSFVMPIAMAYLRVRQQSTMVMVTQVLKTLLTLGLNIYFVVTLEMGVTGILLASLIAAAVFTVLLMAYTLSKTGLRVDFKLLMNMARFGLPLIPSNIAAFMVQASDRYFIKEYASLSLTGIYSLGYKFGTLVHQFVTAPFIQIWIPRRFEYFGRADTEHIYARIFTYFCAVSVMGGLMISLVSREVIMIMATEPYWPAYKIVPIVVLAYIAFSFHYHFNIGILMTKQTKYVAYINIANGILNLVLNFIFISRYDMWGAAIATLICFVFKAVMTYHISNRMHKIHIEWRRVIILFAAGFALYFSGIMIATGALWLDLGLKIMVGLSYPLALYLMRMFDDSEIDRLKKIIKTRTLNVE
jgi:O-antigen/teichoic acid export membrane protein